MLPHVRSLPKLPIKFSNVKLTIRKQKFADKLLNRPRNRLRGESASGFPLLRRIEFAVLEAIVASAESIKSKAQFNGLDPRVQETTTRSGRMGKASAVSAKTVTILFAQSPK